MFIVSSCDGRRRVGHRRPRSPVRMVTKRARSRSRTRAIASPRVTIPNEPSVVVVASFSAGKARVYRSYKDAVDAMEAVHQEHFTELHAEEDDDMVFHSTCEERCR